MEVSKDGHDVYRSVFTPKNFFIFLLAIKIISWRSWIGRWSWNVWLISFSANKHRQLAVVDPGVNIHKSWPFKTFTARLSATEKREIKNGLFISPKSPKHTKIVLCIVFRHYQRLFPLIDVTWNSNNTESINSGRAVIVIKPAAFTVIFKH